MFLNKLGLFFTLLIIVHNVNCIYADSNVPVFIWRTNSFSNPSSLPSLIHIGREQFSSEIDSLRKKDDLVVVFQEDKLSPEDFQCTLDDQSCFKNLKNLQNTNEYLYFPSVESPIQVLQSKSNVEVVTLDNTITESRQHLLASHDEQIREKIDTLQKSNKDFVIVYTARNPSLNVQPKHRVSRQAGNETKVYNFEDLVLLTFANMALHKKDDENKPGEIINLKDHDLSDKSEEGFKLYEVSLKDTGKKYELKFEISMKSGYWSASSFTFYKDETKYDMRSSVEISGIGDFSFHCTPAIQLIALSQDLYPIVTITGLQIQPFLKKQEGIKFGDSLDCVGFMSAPILAGLFVTFMLAAIVALGICMMMDLKTMDRFEDPKGKTITVTATE